VIRAIITGVAGRMGGTMVRLASANQDFRVVGGTEQKTSPALGKDIGTLAGIAPLGAAAESDLDRVLANANAQLVIDFTQSKASTEHARICAARKVALVIGSTGFSADERLQVAEFAQKVPIVLAPNMSVGVNLMIRVAGDLARVLGDGFDVEILEAHHRMKKDAPSGTALRLAEEVAASLGRSPSEFRLAREGQLGERRSKEIGIQALRGGDVVGDHTVFFLGEGERIELTHRATSRDQFGKGALRAARWVVDQSPGLYDMQDVLGLRGGIKQ
jgi:4-hydroxy-tetrahydrodipicolinate reductase